MIDEARGGGGEAEEEAKLDDDEHDGKDDAGQRDQQPDLVVHEIAPGQRSHYSVMLRNSVKFVAKKRAFAQSRALKASGLRLKGLYGL